MAHRRYYATSTSAQDQGRAGRARLRRRTRLPFQDRDFWLTATGFALAAVVLVPLVAALTTFAYYQIFERMLPGIQVGSTRLGNLTERQAAVTLHKEWNLESQVVVSDGFKSRVVSPAELGISLDALATAKNAYDTGHGGTLADNAAALWKCIQQVCQVAPAITWNPEAAQAGLETLAVEMGKAPTDASLRLEGTEPVVVPGELGYTINIPETMEQLQAQAPAVLASGTASLVLAPVAPRVNDVSAALAEAQQLLSSGVKVATYDPISNERQEWEVPREALAAWLRIEPGQDGPVLRIDEAAAADWLAGQNSRLGDERWIDAGANGAQLAAMAAQGGQVDLIVRHKPTTYIVQNGDTLLKIGWKLGFPFWLIQNANPGIDPEGLWVGQELVIPSKDELLPLPVIANKRVVISISKQRMWVYQDGQQIAEHIISTGIDRSPTQPGVFQIQTHEVNAYASVWDLHMPHFLGIYEAWPGFMNGIHGLPTLSNGRRLWANILGKPASYGCIILNLDAAEWLFGWAENGVVVEIQA